MVPIGYRDTVFTSEDQQARADLAQRRRDARHLVEHLRFLEDNVVGPALVKDALLSGLSQSETAKLLGMSKRTVNQNARRTYMECATIARWNVGA